MEAPEQFKMDKTIFSTASLHDNSDEPEYWRTQSHHARMAALEFMRQMMYGYNPISDRIPRLIEVIECPKR